MNSFIKSLMEERNLKQKDLAVILGISSAAISQWAEEATKMNVEHLYALSKLFHVTMDELLEGKRTKESLEDKWSREYDINEDAAKTAFIDGEKEVVLKYLAAIRKADDRFFVLFEKKIIGKISENELKEWEYLKQFYDRNIRRCHLLDDIRIGWSDDGDAIVLNALTDKIGINSPKAIIWELRKVYNITNFGVGITANIEVVPIDNYYNNYDNDLSYVEDDKDIFFAVYYALPPIEKDRFLTSEYQNGNKAEFLFELIKRGGNILYTPRDLKITNYNYKDFDGVEGEMKSVSELNKAHAVIFEIFSNYSFATYEQYCALINVPRMSQIAMEAKDKEKNPIKYWKFIKNSQVLI
ncbi:MAG: helix-turn-helix domain-containing protein [Clostridiales bacterium]|nr:helix-turn-helix domain-containing protein [Clostridiales bacterium]